MSATTYYHGGKSGLNVGDRLVPSPPHVEDGCPICEARRVGRVCTVGAYRAWLRRQGPQAARVLAMLADADDSEPIDPPSAKRAVYITTHLEYAQWYAARSRGDLYQVAPIGQVERSPEDHFPTFTVAEARIVRVLRRGVQLTRSERRHITHLWKKADARVAKMARRSEGALA